MHELVNELQSNGKSLAWGSVEGSFHSRFFNFLLLLLKSRGMQFTEPLFRLINQLIKKKKKDPEKCSSQQPNQSSSWKRPLTHVDKTFHVTPSYRKALLILSHIVIEHAINGILTRKENRQNFFLNNHLFKKN